MIRYLTLNQVLVQQRMVINGTGGKHGFKDIGGVDSAVAQPQMTFGGEDMYPTIPEKAAVLGFSLIKNHGFSDGNKRIGYSIAIRDYHTGVRVDFPANYGVSICPEAE